MNIIIKIISIFFQDLVLKQRRWLIDRSEKKVEKLKTNLKIELTYREELLKDTLKIIQDYENKGN